MAANTQTEEQVSLKLLVNKDTDKVLFAETGKDFIDVLCSFLTLPLGTIAKLVDKESSMEPNKVSCLSSLYRSVARLDVNCLRTATCKEMLLQPRNSSEDFCKCLKLNIDDTEPREYLMCKNLAECKYLLLSTFKNQVRDCGNVLDRSVFVENDKSCNGFVKNGPTFIVTDELIVLLNSLDTSFGLLQSFAISSTSSVKELTVNVTNKQVLDMLKCCLLSKSTLTLTFSLKKYHPSR